LHYAFHFGVVWENLPELLAGAAVTLRLSLFAMLFGLVIGPLGAIARISGKRPLRLAVAAYVELIRNTPFLVQLFIIYLGLPRLGLRLSPDVAALVALAVNLGAYAIEIMRAGIEAVPRGQTEAALALGLRPWQVYRLVILVPALRTVYPALTGQFVLLMLGTSVVSAIAANELTAAANDLQSTTFRAFEVYFVVAGLYLALTLILRVLFAVVDRLWIAQGKRRRAPSRWIGA
jgi:polar amino acid transport system permease protein